MAVSAASVTVATTATVLTSAESDDRAGFSVLVKVPAEGATVYLGGSGVTTGAGYPLAEGEAMAFDLSPGESLFGIVASGTQAVNVLRSGV